MNHHLKELGLTPLVPTNHSGWGPERVQDFLRFAVENFQWIDNHVEDDWWRDEGQSWQGLVEENSAVFYG